MARLFVADASSSAGIPTVALSPAECASPYTSRFPIPPELKPQPAGLWLTTANTLTDKANVVFQGVFSRPPVATAIRFGYAGKGNAGITLIGVITLETMSPLPLCWLRRYPPWNRPSRMVVGRSTRCVNEPGSRRRTSRGPRASFRPCENGTPRTDPLHVRIFGAARLVAAGLTALAACGDPGSLGRLRARHFRQDRPWRGRSDSLLVFNVRGGRRRLVGPLRDPQGRMVSRRLHDRSPVPPARTLDRSRGGSLQEASRSSSGCVPGSPGRRPLGASAPASPGADR
jgi:hypothetical protein